LDVTGPPAEELDPVPAGPAVRALRPAPVTARLSLEFAIGLGMGRACRGAESMVSFTIKGPQFDADRHDSAVRGRTVEEWTMTNPSPMDHPMHLHVWPMQVLDDGESPTWQDVVNIPAFGRVTIRVAFDDIVGRTVYHCH